jgi:hypothetical protein
MCEHIHWNVPMMFFAIAVRTAQSALFSESHVESRENMQSMPCYRASRGLHPED